MKIVTAVIKPHKWEDVRTALEGVGITGMTVSEVSGYGRQKGHTEVYRGAEYKVDLIPKVKLEIVAADTRVAQIVQTLTDAARSGKIGDGKIFVSSMEDAIRIRNGDHGDSAL